MILHEVHACMREVVEGCVSWGQRLNWREGREGGGEQDRIEEGGWKGEGADERSVA